FVAILVAFAFLVLPVVAIFTHVAPGTLIDQLSNPVVHDALIVTLKTTLAAQALILVFGTPTAWFLATRRFPGRSVLITLVELPLARGGLAAGEALCLARSIGEFGATIMFAGSIQGRTQTLALAVYQEFDSKFDVALAISALLVLISLAILLALKLSVLWQP